mgnify:CR=1 FL=1
MLNNCTGVAVLLLNNKLTLKTQKIILNIVEVNTNYKFDKTPLTQKTNSNNVLFAVGDRARATSSLNSNLVQKYRKSYLSGQPYTRYGAGSKLKWFFYKFKYHGKGLKIKKSTKSRTVDFNLGSSHISKLYYNPIDVSLLRTKKNTYTVFTHKLTNFFSSALAKKIRPYNIYTKRGVRISRQTMFRRFGKVSQLSPKKR